MAMAHTCRSINFQRQVGRLSSSLMRMTQKPTVTASLLRCSASLRASLSTTTVPVTNPPDPNFRIASSKINSDRMVEVDLVPAKEMDNNWNRVRLHFPSVYLLDNCSTNFHPSTLQRLSPISQAKLDVGASAVTDDGQSLKINWDSKDVSLPDNISKFTADWLFDHSLEKVHRKKRQYHQLDQIQGLTAADFHHHVDNDPIDFSKLMADDDAELLRLWQLVWRRGLAFVINVPTNVEELGTQVTKMAEKTSYLRNTNYGEVWNVTTKPDPNNLAFTNGSLPLHTDLAYYKSPPDVQLLHCISQAGIGGESRFVDGVAAAHKLKQLHPESYDLLTKTKVRYTDKAMHSDDPFDIQAEHTVIHEEGFDGDKVVTQIFLSEASRCHEINSLGPNEVEDFYRAIVRLREIAENDPELIIEHRVEPGGMFVFNNNRMMHGRNAFEMPASSSSAPRFFHGMYIDWDGIWSRMRVLERDQSIHS